MSKRGLKEHGWSNTGGERFEKRVCSSVRPSVNYQKVSIFANVRRSVGNFVEIDERIDILINRYTFCLKLLYI